VYWGNDTSFNVTFTASNGTLLDSVSLTVDSLSLVSLNHQLPYNYTFTGLPVSISVVDRFGDGFPARLIIDNGSVVFNGTATSSGSASPSLDEGFYNISFEYPGGISILSSNFTVVKDVETSFAFNTSIDAHPGLHSTTVETSISDSLSRPLEGVNVTLSNGESYSSGTTGPSGSVIFPSVYWGNDTLFNITWTASNGSILNSSLEIINVTGTVHLDTVLPYQYIYTGLPVSFSIEDKFGDAYAAAFNIGGTNYTAGSNGLLNILLDEGIYDVTAWWNGSVVNSTAPVTVLDNVTQSFHYITGGIDSRPALHSTTVEASIMDASSRLLPGINVTLSNLDGLSWELTGLDGSVTFPNVYWGNSTSFTVEWTGENGTSIGSDPVEINVTTLVPVSKVLSFNYTFLSVPIIIQLQDRFLDGFAGLVTIFNGTIVFNDTASSTGFLSLQLDEGLYDLNVSFSGKVVNQTSITVFKDVTTSFTIIPDVDAHPSLHSTTVDVTLSDAAGRPIPSANVTLNNSDGLTWETTGSGGNVLFSSVYWGNSTTFDVEWTAANGTMLDSVQVEINSTTATVIDRQWSYNYTFFVPVLLQVIDKFGDGFDARVVLDNGSVAFNDTIGSSGLLSIDLDEGTYAVAVEYPAGVTVNSTSITVVKDTGTSFLITSIIDARPSLHSATVDTSISDNLSRYLTGINVSLSNGELNLTGITGEDGSVSFTGVYWGNFTTFNITWTAPNGTLLNSTAVDLNGTSSLTLPSTLPYQFIYTVPVSFSIEDKFGDGYAAAFDINGTNYTAGSSGMLALTLDEGTYQVTVWWDGSVVNATVPVTIRKDTGQSFHYVTTGIDSRPALHSTTVESTILDLAGRPVPGANVTLENNDDLSWKITGAGGSAVFTGVYWGNFTSFNLTWTASNGTLLDSMQVEINSTAVVTINRSLNYNYTFTGIPVTIQVKDRFDAGFPATLVIDNGSVVFNDTIGSSGIQVLSLDEGFYSLSISLDGKNISFTNFTAVKDTGTYFTFNLSIDAYPAVHSSTIRAVIEDGLGRLLDGINVSAFNSEWGDSDLSVNGDVIFHDVYWGNDTIFNVTWVASNGTVLNTTLVEVNSTGAVLLETNLSSQYIYTGLQVQFSVEDRFGDGYPATFNISGSSHVAGSSGVLFAIFDEGFHAVNVSYSGEVINTTHQIEILKDTGQSFHYNTSIDAYPLQRTVNIETCINDTSRPLFNITVVANNSGGSWNGTTNEIGLVSFSIYWGNDTSLDLAWFDEESNVLETVSIVINDSTAIKIEKTLGYQYIYKGLLVDVSVEDKFGDGFVARLEVYNSTGSLSRNVTTGSSGLYSFYLDEGTYNITVKKDSSILYSNFTATVSRVLNQSSTIPCNVDAYPLKHTTVIETTVEDNLSRYLEGINVTIQTVDSNQSSITGSSGSATFNAYWGNSSSVNVTWSSPNGTVIHSEYYTIVSTAKVVDAISLPYHYIYNNVSVDLFITDGFGTGYQAELDLGTGTNVTCGSNGHVATRLDEGNYAVKSWFGGQLIDSWNVTVLLNQTGFSLTTGGYDSNPVLRTATVTLTMTDNTSRMLEGLDVMLYDATIPIDTVIFGVTDANGIFTTTVYWGNETSWAYQVNQGADILVLVPSMTINSTSVNVTDQLPYTLVYRNVTVEFYIKDKFGRGYQANVELLKNDTLESVKNGTTTATGYYTTLLDEDSYLINITEYGTGKFLDAPDFTVVFKTNQTFTGENHPWHDAYPSLQGATLVTGLEDNESRPITGVQVEATNGEETITGTTDGNGNATLLVYWGNFTSFTISWDDGSGTIHSTGITINESRTWHVAEKLGLKYTFKSLKVKFNVTDKDGDPYTADVSFELNGTVVLNSSANARGYFEAFLDEGEHGVTVWHRGTMVESMQVTISLENHTILYWINTTSYNSKVQLASLKINVKDSLGRDVFPVMVEVNGSGINNVSRSQVTDGGGNVLFPALPYHQNPAYTVKVYFDGSGTILIGSMNVTLSNDIEQRNYTTLVQYLFPDVVTTFTITDHFGLGYRSNITIRDESNITVASAITTGSGQRVVDLDEGNYTVVVIHDGLTVASGNITVIDVTSITFLVDTSIDAYPETHVSPVTISVTDTLGRALPGITAILESSDESYSVVTNLEGKVDFLSVYWGFDQSFNLTLMDVDNETILHEEMMSINRSIISNVTTASRYVFKGVSIEIRVTDANDRGYVATVKILDENGTVVLEGETDGNGIMSMMLDEGNYTVQAWWNGSVVLEESFEVRSDRETTLPVETNIDAYPPVFTIPPFTWVIIIGVAIVIAAGSYAAYRKKERDRRRHELQKARREYIENVAGTGLIMMVHTGSGVPICTNKESGELAGGLFSAIDSFGKEMNERAESLGSISYGGVVYTVEQGKHVNVVVETGSEMGSLMKKRLIDFVIEYEKKHGEDLAKFAGNVTLFDDFQLEFDRAVGTELLQPCAWNAKRMLHPMAGAIARSSMSALVQLMKKGALKNPSMKEAIDVLEKKGHASDEVFNFLYELYVNGFVFPVSSSPKTLDEFMAMSERVATDEERQWYKKAMQGKIDDAGVALKKLDDEVELLARYADEGRITVAQHDARIEQIKEERAAVEKQLNETRKVTFEQWKSAGKRFPGKGDDDG
jgi:hypothetical protein